MSGWSSFPEEAKTINPKLIAQSDSDNSSDHRHTKKNSGAWVALNLDCYKLGTAASQ